MDPAAIPVVDNHCHGLLREPARDRDAFRLLFVEASDPSFAAHVPAMAYYQAALIALAEELGVEQDEDAVLAARAAQEHEGWIAWLLRGAGIAALLIDDGFPAPDTVYTRGELTRIGGCAVGHIWRLETAAQDLIAQHAHFDDLITAWHALLRDIRGRAIVALKSIAAYRTGLAIAAPDETGAGGLRRAA